MAANKQTSKVVSAAQLLSKLAYQHERVPAPEFGEGMEIIVREMSIAGLKAYQDSNFDPVTGKPLQGNEFAWMVSLLVACMVNEDGEPLALQEHVPQLMEALPKSLVDRLLPVVFRLNHMGPKAVEQEKNASAPATP